MKNPLRISIFILGALNGFAWGPDGHMIVAAIAWDKLDSNVKTEAGRLLEENPYYDRWTAGVPEGERAHIAFIHASTWPDDIKSDRNYDNTEGEHPKPGPQAGQNIGYDDKLQHRYWHFYDTAFVAETVPPHATDSVPDRVNALTQIRLFTQAIKTSSDDSIRSYDLVWLIHMVGDVHQPLHATTRFDKQDPTGDQGGNKVHLCTQKQMSSGKTKSCRAELHGFWDDVPGPGAGAEKAITQASDLADVPVPTATQADPAQWINESFGLAKEWAYRKPILVGDGPFVLDVPYRAKAKEIVNERLALAGARLANLLNKNLTTAH